MKKVLKIEKMPTAPGIPKRSPIQVLTGPDVAWLPGADETGYVLRGMAVDGEYVILNKFIIILKSVIRWTWISIGHEKNGMCDQKLDCNGRTSSLKRDGISKSRLSVSDSHWRSSIEVDTFILTWHRRNNDLIGCSSGVRPRHCTESGLTFAITPNASNSGAQFLVVGDCVRAVPLPLK